MQVAESSLQHKVDHPWQVGLHVISVYITVSIQHEGGLGYRVPLSFVLFRIPDPVIMNSELRLTLRETRRIVNPANSGVAFALLQLQSGSGRYYYNKLNPNDQYTPRS
jgi:hypothetical protein